MGVAYSVGEVDHLYTFFSEWSPTMSLKDNEMHCPPRYLIRERHKNCYLTMERDIAVISKLLTSPVCQDWGVSFHFCPSWVNRVRLSDMWGCKRTKSSGAMKLLPENIRVVYFASDCQEPYVEIIKVKDSKRRTSLCSSEESEVEEPEYQEEVDDGLPILTDPSQLLEDHHLASLASHMPARTQGHPLQLVYSTAVHGTSLKTLYRNMAGLDSPVLLVIKDLQKKVFGAFSSDPFKVSKYCYGTGETFLFTFNPDLQTYRWSGKNSYFVSGNWGSLQIGGGGSGFALWLDADLYHGASFSCPTFQNAPLSTHEDFLIQDLEVWTVQH